MDRLIGRIEQRYPNLVGFINEIHEIWISTQPTQLAAALAYFALFSIAPVIYIALSIAGIFLDKAAMLDRFLLRLETTFGTGVSQTIQEMLESISTAAPGSSFLISLISFGFLLLSASGVFYQLQFALNTIWRVPMSIEGAMRRTMRQRLFSFLMVIGVALLLILGSLVGLVSSWIDSRSTLFSFLPYISFIGFIALATVSFGVMYKILPAVKIAWGDVWAGAASAASLIAIGGWLVIFFIKNTNLSSALEAAGSFVVLLSGFYYFAQIFLLGAILTRVYARRYGSKRQQSLSPQPNE